MGTTVWWAVTVAERLAALLAVGACDDTSTTADIVVDGDNDGGANTGCYDGATCELLPPAPPPPSPSTLTFRTCNLANAGSTSAFTFYIGGAAVAISGPARGMTATVAFTPYTPMAELVVNANGGDSLCLEALSVDGRAVTSGLPRWIDSCSASHYDGIPCAYSHVWYVPAAPPTPPDVVTLYRPDGSVQVSTGPLPEESASAAAAFGLGTTDGSGPLVGLPFHTSGHVNDCVEAGRQVASGQCAGCGAHG